jgi:hypothetical protein
MPEHQPFEHLGFQTERTGAEDSGQDFGHGFAGKPLDVIERPKINSKPDPFDDLFVVKGRH